jgi:hypothetical protein
LRQRDSSADADLQDPTADVVGGDNGGLPALSEYTAKHQVIDRRPAVIGALDHFAAEVQLCRFVKLDDFGHGETTRCSDDPVSRAQRFCPPHGGQVAASGSAATLSDCQ